MTARTASRAGPRSLIGPGALPGGQAFRRLLVAHGLGTAAQVVLTLTMGAHVLERTGSGLWVSVTVALAFAPYALLSSFAGVLADRCSRATVLAWCCAVRGALGVVLLFGVVLAWPVPVLVALSAVAAAAATPSYPALMAAVPQCVPVRRLPAANAVATGVENATWIGAPGLFGAAVLAGLPPSVTVAGCCAGFTAAAAFAAAVDIPAGDRVDPRDRRQHRQRDRQRVGRRLGHPGWWRELRVALQLLAGSRAVRRPMVLAVLDNLLYGYLVVAIVLAGAASAATALALGALLALTVVARVATGPRLPALPWAMLVLFAGCVAAAAVAGPGPVALVLVAVAGASTLVAEVASVTLLQQEAPAGVLGRLFGLYDQLNVGAIALGSFLAGPAAALLGPRPALVVVAALCAAPVLGLRR